MVIHTLLRTSHFLRLVVELRRPELAEGSKRGGFLVQCSVFPSHFEVPCSVFSVQCSKRLSVNG